MVSHNANCTCLPMTAAIKTVLPPPNGPSQNCHVLLKYVGLRHNIPVIGTRIVTSINTAWGFYGWQHSTVSLSQNLSEKAKDITFYKISNIILDGPCQFIIVKVFFKKPPQKLSAVVERGFLGWRQRITLYFHPDVISQTRIN